jgi:CheY-like chemotaxis protein
MVGEPKDPTRPTVLVVDDENGPREAFQLVLESQFEVLTAESGWVALEILQKTTVDVITLDLMMPAISGTETLRRIRAIDPQVEVVVVSAVPSRSEIAECRALGAFDFLAKPFSRADILSVVARAAASAGGRGRAKRIAPGAPKRTGTN